ncbi:MAG: ABC transporter permease [Gemmatimonadaceae bacterium]
MPAAQRRLQRYDHHVPRPPAPAARDRTRDRRTLRETPTWFSTMRVPLKRGRLFTDADRAGAPKVVLVSEAAAKKYWPNQDPIGSRVAVYQGGFHDGATVVGVIGDVRYGTIDRCQFPMYTSRTSSRRDRA